MLTSGDGGRLLLRESAIGVTLGSLGAAGVAALAGLTGAWAEGLAVGVSVWVSVAWATLFGPTFL